MTKDEKKILLNVIKGDLSSKERTDEERSLLIELFNKLLTMKMGDFIYLNHD